MGGDYRIGALADIGSLPGEIVKMFWIGFTYGAGVLIAAEVIIIVLMIVVENRGRGKW